MLARHFSETWAREKTASSRDIFTDIKKDVLKCGEREKRPLPSSGSFGLLNNQINMRQIGKRKSNLILCPWEPHVYERVRDTTDRSFRDRKGK